MKNLILCLVLFVAGACGVDDAESPKLVQLDERYINGDGGVCTDTSGQPCFCGSSGCDDGGSGGGPSGGGAGGGVGGPGGVTCQSFPGYPNAAEDCYRAGAGGFRRSFHWTDHRFCSDGSDYWSYWTTYTSDLCF